MRLQAHPMHAHEERVEVQTPRWELLLFPYVLIVAVAIIVWLGA